MSTFAFGYYLETDEITRALFEDIQQDLALATEQLSGFLERDLDKVDDFAKLKQTVSEISSRCVAMTIIMCRCKTSVDMWRDVATHSSSGATREDGSWSTGSPSHRNFWRWRRLTGTGRWFLWRDLTLGDA